MTPTAQESPTSKSNKNDGEKLKLAQVTNSFGAKKGKEWIYHLGGQLLSNALKSLRDLRSGVGVCVRE